MYVSLLNYSPSFQVIDFDGPSLVVLPSPLLEEVSEIEIKVYGKGETFHLDKAYKTIVLYRSLDEVGSEKARQILKECFASLLPGGTLYVGANNRFGLSFLAGVKEEGQELFANVEKANLFSRQRLQKAIKEAGFEDIFFYYPFPSLDRGLTVYSDDNLPSSGSLTNVSGALGQDRYVFFSEEKAFNAEGGSEDFPLIANSFLVMGRKRA